MPDVITDRRYRAYSGGGGHLTWSIFVATCSAVSFGQFSKKMQDWLFWNWHRDCCHEPASIQHVLNCQHRQTNRTKGEKSCEPGTTDLKPPPGYSSPFGPSSSQHGGYWLSIWPKEPHKAALTTHTNCPLSLDKEAWWPDSHNSKCNSFNITLQILDIVAR